MIDFAKWCIEEGIEILTVYAFSTENWNREKKEIDVLMSIFVKYCNDLRVEAKKQNIKINIFSTDFERLPSNVKAGVKQMVSETESCTGFQMCICLSYGSRGEIVNACKTIAKKVQRGEIKNLENEIDEQVSRAKNTTKVFEICNSTQLN